MKLAEGTLIAERFRLTRQLGRGGMGEVWAAHDVRLDSPCAVKFLHPSIDMERATKRFALEAKAAAQLRSPNVVQILDHGEADGAPYIAMELLEGEDLASRLRRLGRLGPVATAAIVSQIARALTRAHAAGLVHRDLKPANIFLVRDDEREIVKVLDFGIAKVVDGLAAHTGPLSLRALRAEIGSAATVDDATQAGTTLGTPSYMSPEQIENLVALDGRTDLWSLGVLTFECLTGRLPFSCRTLAELFAALQSSDTPKPSAIVGELPPAVDDWFARAVARNRDERFQSARDLADALADALGVAVDRDVLPVTTTPPDRSGAIGFEVTEVAQPTPAPRDAHAPRGARWAWVTALLVIALGGLAFWRARVGSSAQPSSATAPASAGRDAGSSEAPPPGSVSGAAALAPPFVRGSAKVVQIVAGFAHSCARYDDGRVACWGRGHEGQLGALVTTKSSQPTLVREAEGAIEIAANGNATCALTRAGGVDCFGAIDWLEAAGPPLSDVASIGFGVSHLCAVTRKGRVTCRGSIQGETLADGSVAGLADIRQVAVGLDHACALEQAGTVLCWGRNGLRQLAGRKGEAGSTTPRQVAGLADVVELRATPSFTCARIKDGSVACWGDNLYGALGVADTRKRKVIQPGFEILEEPEETRPETVLGVQDVVEIASSHYASCVIERGGRLACWGTNALGQLGRGSFQTGVVLGNATPPPPEHVLEGVTHVGFGREHVCASLASGELRCWGRGDEGQIGPGAREACQAGLLCATRPTPLIEQ